MPLTFYSQDTPTNKAESTTIIAQKGPNPQNFIEYSEFGKQLLLFEKGQLIDPEDLAYTDAFNKNKDEVIIPHKGIPWVLYKESFRRVPLVFNSIKNTVDFAIQAGYELEGSADAVKKVEDWSDRVNFETMVLPVIVEHMIKMGQAYMEATSIEQPLMLPPENMYMRVNKGDGKLKGYIQRIYIDDSKNPKWDDPKQIIHFIWNSGANPFYGMSDIHPALTAIERYENWLLDLGQILHRYAAPIIHWKIGDKDHPANDTQVSTVRGVVENRTTGEDVFTTGAVESDVVGKGQMRMMQVDGLVKTLENSVIAAMRIPEVFARGGESSNKATAQVELGAFEKRVKAIQKAISDLLEDQLFPKITGRKSDIKMKWNEFSAEGELMRAQRVKLYFDSGIPADIGLKMVGLGTWANDVKKGMEEKQAADMEMQKELIKAQPKPVGGKPVSSTKSKRPAK